MISLLFISLKFPSNIKFSRTFVTDTWYIVLALLSFHDIDSSILINVNVTTLPFDSVVLTLLPISSSVAL